MQGSSLHEPKSLFISSQIPRARILCPPTEHPPSFKMLRNLSRSTARALRRGPSAVSPPAFCSENWWFLTYGIFPLLPASCHLVDGSRPRCQKFAHALSPARPPTLLLRPSKNPHLPWLRANFWGAKLQGFLRLCSARRVGTRPDHAPSRRPRSIAFHSF